MASIFADFHEAQRVGSGHLLASCLAPINTAVDLRRLQSFVQLSNYQTVSADVRFHLLQDRSAVKLPKAEGNAWVEIFTALWVAVKELLAVEHSLHQASWSKTFDAYKEVCNLLIRGYSNHGFQAWTVPCLYVTGKYLRLFAVKADAESKSKETTTTFGNGFQDDIVGNHGNHEKLEQAAWIINRMFTICLSDRSEITESRKWGIYSTTNLLFKTYFKLNSIGLSKNVLRALAASEADIPALTLFPASHRVTFKYYRGIIAFLEENYTEAEGYLTEALDECHPEAHKNRELLLTYLIPCHLLTTHTLPSARLLAPYPRLDSLFSPLCRCIRHGDLSGFDAALAAGEAEFVRRRIYLTLERGRDIAMRNLFRKVFLAGGFEEASKEGQTPPVRRTRIPVTEFAAAMRVGSSSSKTGPAAARVDLDEVECFLANLIYKNLIKGYIARERGIVVLSKGGAFPGTGV